MFIYLFIKCTQAALKRRIVVQKLAKILQCKEGIGTLEKQ